MAEIKIIFFDIDGTLVDPATRQIPASTRQALLRLRERGILLCVATGRPPASLPDFSGLHFDVFSTFNGSLCYTDTETIYANPISRRDVDQLLKNAAALGRPVSVAVRHRLAANGVDQDLADYYHLADLELAADADFDDACKEPIYQIMLGSREDEHAAILRGTENGKIAISWDRAVDVIPADSGKGTAIAQILAHFGLDASQALAFGDSYNDLDMLRAVGTGVAMGNAAQALKDIASDVCGHVSEDGIYNYCVSHGLI